MIVDYFHDLILNWFPVGTNQYLMHFIVMAVLALIVVTIVKSDTKTWFIIYILCVFIELDQYIFKTGCCDALDIVAGCLGCVAALYIRQIVIFYYYKFKRG